MVIEFGIGCLINQISVIHVWGKIKQLSIDSKEEEKYIKELFDKHDKYEDFNLELAYLQGVEDMLDILSHNRFRNIKINKQHLMMIKTKQ